MRDMFKKKEVVVIYSVSDLIHRNSAASARMMNYARALSSKMIVVFLSYEYRADIDFSSLSSIENNIYSIGSLPKNKNNNRLTYFIHLLKFVLNLDRITNKIKVQGGNVNAFLFYPNTDVLIDFFSCLFLIKIRRHRIFYETNEVRKFSSLFMDKPSKLIHKLLLRWFKIKYMLSERLARYFTGLICISTNIKNYFNQYNSNSILIPILANVEESGHEHNSFSYADKVFKIGFFGYVNYHKENLDVLLQSLNRFNMNIKDVNFEMHFYGPMDNFTNKKLQNKINNLKLTSKVFYRGQLKHREVRKHMCECELLVLPRGFNLQNHYGFSTKLGEYLASGVPSLITDVSDNSLYVKDGINGFVVPPDDIESFSGKLEFIYMNYNDYVKDISRESKRTVKEHFNYRNYGNALIDFITEY